MTETRKRARQTYTVTCVWGCGTTWTTPLRPPAEGVGCGANPECTAKHNAAVAEVDQLRRERAVQRRQERATRPAPQPVTDDWATLGLFLGATRKKS